MQQLAAGDALVGRINFQWPTQTPRMPDRLKKQIFTAFLPGLVNAVPNAADRTLARLDEEFRAGGENINGQFNMGDTNPFPMQWIDNCIDQNDFHHVG